MSHSWHLLGSVVFSKMWGHQRASEGNSGGGGLSTPNSLINAEGRLNFDRPLVIKLQATYMFPVGINLSGSYYFVSGLAYTRSVGTYVPNYDGTVSIFSEPQGSRREPSHNNLDLRIEKEFALASYGTFGIFLDVFNAFNSAIVYVSAGNQGYIDRFGDFIPNYSWQTISGIQGPRRVMVGMRFRF